MQRRTKGRDLQKGPNEACYVTWAHRNVRGRQVERTGNGGRKVCPCWCGMDTNRKSGLGLPAGQKREIEEEARGKGRGSQLTTLFEQGKNSFMRRRWNRARVKRNLNGKWEGKGGKRLPYKKVLKGELEKEEGTLHYFSHGGFKKSLKGKGASFDSRARNCPREGSTRKALKPGNLVWVGGNVGVE